MIKTKRNPYKFLKLSVVFILCLSIPLFIYFGVDSISSIDGYIAFTIILFSLGSIALFIDLTLKFINSRTIIINEGSIFFGKKEYQLSDIKKIWLIDHSNMTNTIMRVRFKNGKEEKAYDDLYTNLWQIKCKLDEYINHKEEPIPETFLRTPVKGQMINKLILKRHQLKTFNGLLLLGFLILMTYVISTNDYNHSFKYIFICSMMIIGILFLYSKTLNYIVLSDTHLAVKNQHFPWVNDIYKLENIKQAIIVDKQVTGYPNLIYIKRLQLITTDYKSKFYLAESLSEKHWVEFKNHLQKKGIEVNLR